MLNVSISKCPRCAQKLPVKPAPVPGLAKIIGLADESDPARMCHVREWALAMIEQAGHSREMAQVLLQRMLRP